MVLICISQMTKKAKHLFMYLLDIYITYFVQCLFTSSAQLFLIGLFVFYYWFIGMIYKVYSGNKFFDVCIENILFQSMFCPFIFLMVCFDEQRF